MSYISDFTVFYAMLYSMTDLTHWPLRDAAVILKCDIQTHVTDYVQEHFCEMKASG